MSKLTDEQLDQLLSLIREEETHLTFDQVENRFNQSINPSGGRNGHPYFISFSILTLVVVALGIWIMQSTPAVNESVSIIASNEPVRLNSSGMAQTETLLIPEELSSEETQPIQIEESQQRVPEGAHQVDMIALIDSMDFSKSSLQLNTSGPLQDTSMKRNRLVNSVATLGSQGLDPVYSLTSSEAEGATSRPIKRAPSIVLTYSKDQEMGNRFQQALGEYFLKALLTLRVDHNQKSIRSMQLELEHPSGLKLKVYGKKFSRFEWIPYLDAHDQLIGFAYQTEIQKEPSTVIPIHFQGTLTFNVRHRKGRSTFKLKKTEHEY